VITSLSLVEVLEAVLMVVVVVLVGLEHLRIVQLYL
jgi:hypothetical protein